MISENIKEGTHVFHEVYGIGAFDHFEYFPGKIMVAVRYHDQYVLCHRIKLTEIEDDPKN